MKLVPHIILSVLTVCLATECTKVNYGAPEDMPESVAVSFKFDWQDQETPGEMYVVMSRIINTVHYGWLVAPDGTVTGQIPDYETPQDDGTGDENTGETGDDEGNTGTGEGNDGGQTDETATENTAGKGVDVEYDTDNPTVLPSMTVMNGEYYIMSFNQNVTSFSTSGLQAFLNDPAASMKDIRLSAIKMTDEEVLTEYGGERTDFNPLYDFIRDITPVYIEVQQVQISPDRQSEFTLTPSLLSQKITFRINMEIENGVTLENVMAEISGLAGSVETMTGQIDNEETFRSLMTMEEVSSEGNRKIYEGTINTFGLFPSKDQTFITGPGILQVTIRATDGTDTKVFHAGINIRQTITDAGILAELENGKFRIARNEVTLEIPNTLKIDKDQIAPGEDQGVEIWIDSDEILDVEI